jgi:hypothetical protein
MPCADQLKPHLDHMNKKEPGKVHVIRVVLVTNNFAGIVDYCEATLNAWNPPIASGAGFSYSNRERWNFPQQPFPNLYPFDPNRRDNISLSVNLTTGQVAGVHDFQGQCENDVLYGFSEPALFVGLKMMHVLALLDLTEAEAPPMPG